MEDCVMFLVMSSQCELIKSGGEKSSRELSLKCSSQYSFSLPKFNTECIMMENTFTFALFIKWEGTGSSVTKAMSFYSRALASLATQSLLFLTPECFLLHFFISSFKRKRFKNALEPSCWLSGYFTKVLSNKIFIIIQGRTHDGHVILSLKW